MMRWHYLSGGKLLKQPSRDALVILHAEAPREAIWAHPLRGGISVLLADNNWEICCQVSTKDNEIFFSTRIIGKKKKTWVLSIRDDFFLFNLIFIKKIKLNFFKKKTKTGLNRLVSVSVWFFGQKPVQIGLTRFFQFDSVFSSLTRFFSGFFLFGFDSVFSVSGL